MRIPEVRVELLKVADTLDRRRPKEAKRIRELVAELYRRQRLIKTAPKSQKLTPALRSKIKLSKKLNPDMSIQEIAVACGVNSGRVSEVLIGKRT